MPSCYTTVGRGEVQTGREVLRVSSERFRLYLELTVVAPYFIVLTGVHGDSEVVVLGYHDRTTAGDERRWWRWRLELLALLCNRDCHVVWRRVCRAVTTVANIYRKGSGARPSI
jgi:hypothetical protein